MKITPTKNITMLKTCPMLKNPITKPSCSSGSLKNSTIKRKAEYITTKSQNKNPFEIIALWHGGLSFHGGFIGAAIACFLFCRKKKINFYTIADIAVIPLALGLAFGRIGNFTNGELYGRITNIPWAVKFPNVDGYRHPSQIYESMKN